MNEVVVLVENLREPKVYGIQNRKRAVPIYALEKRAVQEIMRDYNGVEVKNQHHQRKKREVIRPWKTVDAQGPGKCGEELKDGDSQKNPVPTRIFPDFTGVSHSL